MKQQLFRRLLFLLFCGIGFSACHSSTVVKNEDGVTVRISSSNEVKTIRLQIVSDDIIHVSASPADTFSKRESLIAVYPETQKTGWLFSESPKDVQVSTATTRVTVSWKTGEIVFTDKEGRVLLAENKGGGKSFQAMEADGERAFSVRGVFESPDDEAFYGLGQHQSDEFNYKGKNEVLYQYNTKVSIPFIVSSKNYGLLWDNYSLTKFGDPRDYARLDQFILYDKYGKQGGLTASYRNRHHPEEVFIERQESSIDYDHLGSVKNFPQGFPLYQSEISWEGEIQPQASGIYRFLLYYAGYVKVYVDDRLVVAERWRTAWNPNSYKFNANLEKGRKHKLKIEWKPDGGVSYLSLKALSPVDPAEQNKLSFWSELADQIDYYFIRGNTMDDVISGYRQITGKAQIMPKWAMGFWQSRERYKTQAELLSVLKEFRKRQIPIDNIVQDWSYWPEDAWGSHDFDLSRFPDATAMVEEVHRLNARIMISVWPKFYHTTDNYKAFDEKGWMYRLAVQDSIRDWIGKGYIGSFYDAYSSEARRLFWDQMNEKLYSRKFDAWWMDASEPDILSNADIKYRKALMNPTALGSSTRYFNAYGLMNAKGIYEGQRGTNNEDRVFLLTRSGFAGSQRYAAVIWSGDIGTRWEDMKAQISAGLNFSIAGNPYWTMDNGGFCVENRYAHAHPGSEDLEEWRELNNRWHQFGAFVPLFRSHGQYPYREIWNIAPETHPAYQSMLYYNRLRYRLMPYLYSLAGWTYWQDYTIMRPLAMDFAQDKQVLNIGDQYMFGPALMVCPIYEYKAREREVYFPAGIGWYDMYTGKYVTGGRRLKVEAPYDRMPLFAAAGSILPMGKVIQHTQEEQKDLTIYVYGGKDGTFTLYEDEGTNYNYEKGACATIPFIYDDAAKTLTIGDRAGNFRGMNSPRIFHILFVDKDNPVGIDAVKIPVKVSYDGQKQIVQYSGFPTPINKGKKKKSAMNERISPPQVPAAKGNQKASLYSPIIKGINPSIVEKIVRKMGVNLTFHALI
jgi:alpha-D-xyloside xylohydrolase